MIGQQYEFVVYGPDCVLIGTETRLLRGDGAARMNAGRLARKNGGPVDLAYAGNAEWEERYITTASPCEFTKSGARFERLA